MSNEEVMIPKSYHDKVCEEIIRFKDKQFYDAVHLLDDGTLEIHVTDYKMVKRVLVEDDNNFGNLFCEDKANRPQGEWIYGEHNVAMCDGYRCNRCDFFVPWDYEHKFIDFINDYHYCPSCGARMKGADDE